MKRVGNFYPEMKEDLCGVRRVGLGSQSRTRGFGADGGVRPTAETGH
jgi:hypothetical protein